MIKKIDMTDSELAKEVLAIQIPSYKIEAEIIDFYDIPPLNDNVATLQQCGETFFGYYSREELCGVISIKMENGIIDICRLMVHPDHFRKGIAKLLLDFVERDKANFDAITVSTGTRNIPAVSFYLKNGFLKNGEVQVAENVSLTLFKKEI